MVAPLPRRVHVEGGTDAARPLPHAEHPVGVGPAGLAGAKP